MYRELLGEMTKRGISKKELANRLGITERSFNNKIKGITDFTWMEVKNIRQLVAPEISLEKLFNENDTQKAS